MKMMFSVIQDHPHAYGDKSSPIKLPLTVKGSSPRVWGQGVYLIIPILVDRIIPTRMGTSRQSGQYNSQERDHPHAYGDKRRWTMNARDKLGSSPRVWGQARHNNFAERLPGIIPTRMGTRVCKNHTCDRVWDHPHAYGDKSVTGVEEYTVPGSSPRVWGQADQRLK